MILCGVIETVITERDFESGYNLCWGWKKSPHASKLWYAAAVPCLVLVPMFDWLYTYFHKELNIIKRLPIRSSTSLKDRTVMIDRRGERLVLEVLLGAGELGWVGKWNLSLVDRSWRDAENMLIWGSAAN